jgi:hypothetical protein
MDLKITPQAVGAAGEKLVEAKLLRRGWLPANANASVRNAAVFDIHAEKKGRVVSLRVKTCGPGIDAFQFNDQLIQSTELGRRDYTILVAMGSREAEDRFYIIPTSVVRDEVAARRQHFLKTPKRDGSATKDKGHWALRLNSLRSGDKRPGWGLKDKWQRYLDTWQILDEDRPEGRGALRRFRY